MDHNQLYIVFESCWELVNRLNEEKSLGMGKLARLAQTFKLYVMILKTYDEEPEREPVHPFDLVDWSGKPE